MQPRSLALALSLGLNGVALIAGVISPSVVPPPVRDFFARHWAREKPAPLPPQPRAALPAARAKLWQTLDAGGNLPTLVARLRSAGFPSEIVRAMILAEIGARYDARMRAIFEPDPTTPFWKLGSNISPAGDRRMDQYSQLLRERTKVQRELLLDPFFAADDITAAQRRQFGDLSRQKIDLLQRIEDDYAEMGAAIRATTKGILLAEDREKLELLMRERRADLAGVLSPGELADYEMRSSPLTGMIVRQLGGFNPSEAEFQAIFQAQKTFSEKLGPTAMSGGGNFQERQAGQEALNAQLKAALGEKRFGDYVRETDRTYQQLVRLTERDGLSTDLAVRAFNVRDTVALESGRIADDAALNMEQKRAALQALAERTRQQILGILGPTTGAAYVKIVDERWLNSVQRGNAVSFGGSGGAMTYVSQGPGGAMPVTASFGLSPSFRTVVRPMPPP